MRTAFSGLVAVVAITAAFIICSLGSKPQPPVSVPTLE